MTGDGSHGLIRYDMHMDYSGWFPVIDKKYGPIFIIHALYSQFLNIFAWILLIKAAFFKNTIYRQQALSLLLGLSFIIIPNIMYISGISPVKRFDITPLFFGPAGLITAWGIFHYRLFDVIPLAWATVIKTMEAGVLVLDLQDRVLDINPAFEKIVGYTASMVSTRQIEEVCIKVPELASAFEERSTTYREFSINTSGMPRVYEVLISPLTDDMNITIGRLAVIYDITKKKQEQQAYLRQQWKQAVTMEKERHARDLHDNLGQVLGFISFQAQGIKQELTNAGIEIVSQELDKLVGVAQSTNNEIREYIRNARNEKAVEEDFISSLKHYLLNFEEQSGVNATLNITFQFQWEEINPNVKINILNIIKEASNNIRKHAEARNINVSFSIVLEQICVIIEDDGKGFDMDRQDTTTNIKFGLSIMRERALEIGAHIDIKSTPGKGSRIVLYVPIKGEEKNEYESYASR